MSKIEFLPYNDDLKVHFYQINKEWVSSMFEMEDMDEKILKEPQKYIISRGGYIWFAKHDELGVVGSCALCKTAEGEYELTKMGVLEKARGLKVGEKLLNYVLAEAQKLPIQTLYLLTNKKCEAAIHLYLKNGFVHDEQIMDKYGKKYERCNVAMKFHG